MCYVVFEFTQDERGTWHGGGIRLANVHAPYLCEGRHCIIHNPVHTHMDDWPLHWRDDRGIFERICPHGVGHPDPSEFDFWAEIGRDWEQVHGCDGCCATREESEHEQV